MSSATPDLRIDGAIATVTLRRPAQANRLTAEDLDRLRQGRRLALARSPGEQQKAH